MICPKCGAEYVPGVEVCFDCDVDLVEAAPDRAQSARPAEGKFELVPVFATTDSGLVAIAETMLQSAGIPVVIEGAAQQAYWGPGALGLHQPRGQSVVCVAPRDADDAREILADLLREG
jgi:hypothetical protein